MKRRISKPGKGKVFLGNRFKQVLLFCLITAMVGCFSGQPPGKTAREIIAVIERDTLQTRNFVPVINHDAMIVNLTHKAMTIEIHSAIPPGKYLKDSPHSAFGTDSLLGGPMFAPFTLPIKGHIILEKPKVNRMGKGVSYYWDNVVLPSGQAVRAQYDNYYGPASDFYFNHGMSISGLDIKSDYTVKVEKEKKEEILYQLGLHLTLENAGEQDVVEMFFRVFVPFALALEDKGDLHSLVEPVEIWFSENLKVATISLVDGFGNAARGVEASVQIGTLKTGDTFHCALQIDCSKKAKEGEIYPVMTLLGRRQLVRAWPATIVKGAPPETQEKFHYLLYNLVIGARRIFHIHKKGITVIRVENLKQARFQ
jgi:hypothetical protein